MKDGWLSEDACLEGESMAGVPDLLIGREKLNDGRGRAEESEPTEGDLRKDPRAGDIIGLINAALPEESFRGGREWNEPDMLPEPSSSVGNSGEDMMLEDLLGNRARGGAKPSSSNECCLYLSGEPLTEPLGCCEGRKRESSFREGEVSACRS